MLSWYFQLLAIAGKCTNNTTVTDNVAALLQPYGSVVYGVYIRFLLIVRS